MPYSLFSSSPSNLRATSLVLNRNPIFDFTGLPTLEFLTELYLDATNLSSFQGAEPQPSLHILSFTRTPLVELPAHRIMAWIVFPVSGKPLTVNGNTLSASERRFCLAHGDDVLADLLEGWVIVSMEPLKLMHAKTRERRTLFLGGDVQKSQNVAEDASQGGKRDSGELKGKENGSEKGVGRTQPEKREDLDSENASLRGSLRVRPPIESSSDDGMGVDGGSSGVQRRGSRE
jgi:hypothetical protein